MAEGLDKNKYRNRFLSPTSHPHLGSNTSNKLGKETIQEWVEKNSRSDGYKNITSNGPDQTNDETSKIEFNSLQVLSQNTTQTYLTPIGVSTPAQTNEPIVSVNPFDDRKKSSFLYQEEQINFSLQTDNFEEDAATDPIQDEEKEFSPSYKEPDSEKETRPSDPSTAQNSNIKVRGSIELPDVPPIEDKETPILPDFDKSNEKKKEDTIFPDKEAFNSVPSITYKNYQETTIPAQQKYIVPSKENIPTGVTETSDSIISSKMNQFTDNNEKCKKCNPPCGSTSVEKPPEPGPEPQIKEPFKLKEGMFEYCMNCCVNGNCMAKDLLKACREDPDCIINILRKNPENTKFGGEYVSRIQKTHGKVFGDPKYHYLMVDVCTSMTIPEKELKMRRHQSSSVVTIEKISLSEEHDLDTPRATFERHDSTQGQDEDKENTELPREIESISARSSINLTLNPERSSEDSLSESVKNELSEKVISIMNISEEYPMVNDTTPEQPRAGSNAAGLQLEEKGPYTYREPPNPPPELTLGQEKPSQTINLVEIQNSERRPSILKKDRRDSNRRVSSISFSKFVMEAVISDGRDRQKDEFQKSFVDESLSLLSKSLEDIQEEDVERAEEVEEEEKPKCFLKRLCRKKRKRQKKHKDDDDDEDDDFNSKKKKKMKNSRMDIKI